MTRIQLLGAASAAALACLSTASIAKKAPPPQPSITGGGSTLAQFDYIDEYGTYNNAKAKATFSTYYESGSGTGQQAFLADDLTCDINKVLNNGLGCQGPAGGAGNTVSYGASDATFSSAQIASWATSSFGQSAAADLIQIPSMGVGIAFPVVNPSITGNQQVAFTDNDLCGIFSGLITDFSQITDTGASLSGAFQVAYRSDGSGTSFILTNHLNAVCNSSNTAPGVTFTATTTFATLFPSGVPSTFVPESGSNAVAAYLAGCSAAGSVANGVGYISPDFTTVDASSDATIKCSDGSTESSPLSVASFKTLNNIPSVANITTGLTHVVLGSNTSPPSNARDAANPALWVPLVQTVSAGYGVVGYTTFDFAQCYANPSVAAGIIAFLKDHYGKASYVNSQHKNGFVSLKDTKASTFETAILNEILANKKSFNTDIENATACSGLAGR